MSLAGRRKILTRWPVARWPVILLSAGRKRPAAISPTGIWSRTVSPILAIRLLKWLRMAVLFAPSPTKRAALSISAWCRSRWHEIGDPQAYMLPDVTCDFSAVTISEQAANRVAVAGARGLPPSDTYKVSATYFDGFRVGTLMSFVGLDAADKGRAFAEAGFERARAGATAQFGRLPGNQR